ncbi:MAG: ABC transporter substrate-binding protein [Anaerolineales bacterium]|nr:ABC transporter substrate-binding protein [Anaerolineales bacterium]
MKQQCALKGGLSRRGFLKLTGAAGAGMAAAPWLLAGCSPAVTTSQPLKIGLLLPYSAVYAELGNSIERGVRMYLDETGNEAGGRSIEIITEDEGATPDDATPKARKLVEQDEVDIVAGIVSSGVLGALRDYFDSNKKLLICANAGANGISRGGKTPYIWRTSFSNWQPNWPVGPWAAENVGKRVFVSVPDYAAGHNMRDAFLNSYQAAGGEAVGLQVTPFPNIGDPAPFITEIANADVDFLYCFYSGGQAVTFLKAYGDFGLAGKLPLLCAGFMVEEDVLPAEGDYALGARSGLHWALYLDNPENKTFVEAYRAKYPDKTPDVFAVQGYDTGRVIVEMLNRTQGDSSADKMVAALDGISFASPRGPFTLDAATQNPKQHIYLREVQAIDGAPHNVSLADLGEVADPGDDSKG